MIGVVRWANEFACTEPEQLEGIGMEVGAALENARLYSAAVEAADHDPVTGLFNHRALHQRLDRALEKSKKHNTPLSIIMMDLSNFKLFNDTYGHPVGDIVLKNVATISWKRAEKRMYAAGMAATNSCLFSRNAIQTKR